MTILTHSFNNSPINQLSEDTVIGGKRIPKGYVNATSLCKAANKKLDKYFDFSKTKPFLNALEAICGSPSQGEPELVIVISGNTQQGTWVSPAVALNLAQWISSECAAWSSVVLVAVLNGDFKALTPEAEKAKRNLQELWEKIRRAGIDIRRGMTDSVQDWYQRNPGGTSRPEHVMYAVVTNLIYQSLWEMDAKEIEIFLGCGRHECRDFMTAECLKVLERAESLVMDLIDEDNLKPIDAVAIAGLRKSRHPLARREF